MKALVHEWWPAFTIVQGLTKYDANDVIREYEHKYYGHLSYKILQTESKFCWHQQFLSHGCMGAELLLQDFKTSFEFKTMSHSTEIGTLLNSKFVYKTSSLNSWLNIFKRIKPHGGGESFEVKGLWSSLKNQAKLTEKVMMKSVVNNREY